MILFTHPCTATPTLLPRISPVVTTAPHRPKFYYLPIYWRVKSSVKETGNRWRHYTYEQQDNNGMTSKYKMKGGIDNDDKEDSDAHTVYADTFN